MMSWMSCDDRVPGCVTALVLSACVLLGASGRVVGQTLNWNNPAGGSASTASNWTPAQVPTSANTLNFPLNNTYTVTFNSAVTQTMTQRYNAGTVTIDLDASHTCSFFRVADDPGNTSAAILGFGVFNAGSMRLGDESTSTGTFTVGGAFTDVFVTGSSIVGDDGSGTLNVQSGGLVDMVALTIGRTATANGFVQVLGAASFPPTASHLDMESGIVGSLGFGSLEILEGGRVTCHNDLVVAPSSGATGVMFMDGGVAPPNSTMTIHGDLYIASNTAATAAGSGTLNVSRNSTATVDGTTFLGDANGSDAWLLMDNNGTLITGSLICQSASTLQLDGGMVVIDGGVFDPPGNQVIIEGSAGTNPVVELRNNASIAGGAGTNIRQGELRLTQGTQLSQTVLVGQAPGGVGTLTINSGTSLTSNGLAVGTLGEGNALVNGQLLLGAGTGDLLLGTQPGGFGFVDILGPAALVVADDLIVTRGILTIGDGAQVHLSSSPGAGNVTIHEGSIVHVLEGSVLDLEGATSTLIDVQSGATLNMLGGTVNADLLDMEPGSSEVSGYGTINASIDTGGNINAAGGTLTLGNPNDVNGFAGFGSLHVGNATVVILDQDGAELRGNPTIAGGTLELPGLSHFLGIVEPGETHTFSGHGTIKGSWVNQAIITASGPGLTIIGSLTHLNEPGNAINGTQLTFGLPPAPAASGGAQTGSFVGSGLMDCKVLVNGGSRITANGNLSLGVASNALGVTLNGRLDVGSHTVTLLDSNGVNLGELTTMNGGTLIQSIFLLIDPGDVFQGFGTIQTSSGGLGGLRNGGIVRPGPAIGTGIGTLNLTQSYHYPSTTPGDLEIEIASLASVDKVVAGASANLDGDLIIKPISGFAPAIGSEVVIITASSVSGTFDRAIYLGASCIDVLPIYEVNQVKVRFINSTCPGDVNDDDVINVTDLLAVITAWGSTGPQPADTAPACGDGVVNVSDLLAVISGWGACP